MMTFPAVTAAKAKITSDVACPGRGVIIVIAAAIDDYVEQHAFLCRTPPLLVKHTTHVSVVLLQRLGRNLLVPHWHHSLKDWISSSCMVVISKILLLRDA